MYFLDSIDQYPFSEKRFLPDERDSRGRIWRVQRGNKMYEKDRDTAAHINSPSIYQ